MSSRTFLGIGALALTASLVACTAHQNDPSSTTSAPANDKAAAATPAKNGEPIVLDPAAKLRFESMNSKFDGVVAPTQNAVPNAAIDEKSFKASVHKSGVTLGAQVPLAVPATNGGAQ